MLDIQAAQAVWSETKKMLADPEITLVLLDEITCVARYDYVDIVEIIATIQSRPKMQSVIITGCGRPKALEDIANTVSEICNERHAYRAG